jgi:hypothetical protein
MAVSDSSLRCADQPATVCIAERKTITRGLKEWEIDPKRQRRSFSTWVITFGLSRSPRGTCRGKRLAVLSDRSDIRTWVRDRTGTISSWSSGRRLQAVADSVESSNELRFSGLWLLDEALIRSLRNGRSLLPIAPGRYLETHIWLSVKI